MNGRAASSILAFLFSTAGPISAIGPQRLVTAVWPDEELLSRAKKAGQAEALFKVEYIHEWSANETPASKAITTLVGTGSGLYSIRADGHIEQEISSETTFIRTILPDTVLVGTIDQGLWLAERSSNRVERILSAVADNRKRVVTVTEPDGNGAVLLALNIHDSRLSEIYRVSLADWSASHVYSGSRVIRDLMSLADGGILVGSSDSLAILRTNELGASSIEEEYPGLDVVRLVAFKSEFGATVSIGVRTLNKYDQPAGFYVLKPASDLETLASLPKDCEGKATHSCAFSLAEQVGDKFVLGSRARVILGSVAEVSPDRDYPAVSFEDNDLRSPADLVQLNPGSVGVGAEAEFLFGGKEGLFSLRLSLDSGALNQVERITADWDVRSLGLLRNERSILVGTTEGLLRLHLDCYVRYKLSGFGPGADFPRLLLGPLRVSDPPTEGTCPDGSDEIADRLTQVSFKRVGEENFEERGSWRSKTYPVEPGVTDFVEIEIAQAGRARIREELKVYQLPLVGSIGRWLWSNPGKVVTALLLLVGIWTRQGLASAFESWLLKKEYYKKFPRFLVRMVARTSLVGAMKRAALGRSLPDLVALVESTIEELSSANAAGELRLETSELRGLADLLRWRLWQKARRLSLLLKCRQSPKSSQCEVRLAEVTALSNEGYAKEVLPSLGIQTFIVMVEGTCEKMDVTRYVRELWGGAPGLTLFIFAKCIAEGDSLAAASPLTPAQNPPPTPPGSGSP